MAKVRIFPIRCKKNGEKSSDIPHPELGRSDKRFLMEEGRMAYSMAGTEVSPFAGILDGGASFREQHFERFCERYKGLVGDFMYKKHEKYLRDFFDYFEKTVVGEATSEKEESASSETKQSKSTAEEKPFNAVIEMLRKKFPDASMEALTAADRLLREQALPGERQKAIEAVAKALGLKVEWRDTMEKENGTFNPKTRTITIARDSEHALANTFGHEVTHAVRNLSEADYKNLKDAVRRLYSSEKEYNEAVQAYGDMYTGLDFDALEEELIADNIGFMIGGRNDMTQELASRMNHRVLWAIHDAMNKVRNALAKVLHIDSKKNGLLEAIDSARATIRETMANAQRIAKEKGQGLSNESGSARQSLRTQDSASEFAEKHGVAADNVRQYAEGIKSGNLQKADLALSEIRRTMRVANRGMKLSEFGKLFRPIQNELAERYGGIERLRQEYIDAEMRERNLMETARKKAEEEERNRQERLEELSLLGDAEVDKRYMDALKRGDEATAREMLDEAARRKGYGDAESDYQGEGAWAAPSNPGYKSADERRADLENNTIFNVEDMALGYSAQPEDYFKYPKRYAQDTPHGRESTQSIQKAIEAVKRGEKDVKVKVYRAVPTSVKEGKLRNGDWVTPSKKYAEMHGNSRLEGKYRIIEDEVPVDELWWDGNDANEWGYDNGKGYKYKNVKNNRKSDDLVTRDDKGNVIPPSKRFNQRKADERYHKFGMPIKPNSAEVALRDALVERMRLSGMDVISDEAGQRVLDEANGKVREMSFGEAYDYDAYPLGRVEPNLAEKEVAVVEADVNHGFANYKEAKAWAKQHVSKVYNNEESGGKGEVRISNAAIDKFMSQSAIDKSDSKDVHMAVLKVLPEVLKSSIDVETHPDFLKGEDGKRRAENGMNKDVLVHRCYGAVSIDGKPYRVKITLKEEVRNKKLPHNTHSYEATKIELLAGQHGDVTMTSPRNSNSSKQVEQSAGTLVKPKGDNPNTNNSISAAKLLENVGMSYNSGEKVLDASKKRSEGLREQRVWHGSGAEFDAFDHSHMGSGEGLQIHGYGTYVSVSQGMAEGYARKLSDDEGSSYLYRVEIPDNTGYNYLEEGGTYTPDDVVRQKVDAVLKEKGLKSLGDENLTGRKLYREVQNRANGKKAASELLSESGLKGVHYFGRADGECYVIFNEKDVKITDHVRFFRTANGEAYGFTVGGRIYIDPRIATSETPVHEYAHLWATALKSANAKEWQNVVGLMKGTKVWDEVKALYPELKSDDEIADEVLATYSGRRGAERLREEQRRIAKGNGSVFEKAEAISALESVKQALKRFWKGVADFLHIHYTSAEEVADRVMKDLLDGVDPRSMMDGGRSLRHDTRINVVEGNTEHGFKNYAEAKDWAKEKIARTYNSEETGGKGDIRISNAAINKYLSQSAVDKSDSKDVHLSVLKVLPEVIRESVDAEQHADFKKGEDGVRSAENGINPNVTIHRLYGAVRMGGRLYRVKVTLKEDKTSKEPKVPHSYEATKIELFAGTLGNSDNSLSPNTNNSITAAKLLKGVEKSYGGGKFFEDYNKVREQFIGEQGAERADHAEEVTTRIDNLNVAREMEDAKKDAKAIKLATGWERGADGKWRYEIPDLKYFGKGDAGYKKARGKQPWSKELDGLSDKIFDGEELSESEYKRFDELAQKEDDFKTDYLNREKPHLADWVENDELFKAYPDLKRVNVVFNDQLPANHGGSYNEREHTIVVNTNYVGDIDSVLAHEVQHAIQRIEGFARGSNTDYIDSIKETIDDIKNLFLESLNRIAEIRGIPTFDEWFSSLDENAMLKVGDSIPYYFKRGQFHGFDVYYYYYVDNIGFNESDKKKIKAKLEKAENAISKENKILGDHYNRRSFDLYETIAGEVESRNVEKRMGMSPEERRASLAAETEDVSREDQIFLFGEGGTSMKTSSDLNEMFGNPKTNGMTVSDMKRKVADLFEKAHTGEFKGKPQRVGRLSRKGKAYLEKLSGLQFKEYVDFVLNPSDLNHIRGDHYGQNEKDKGNNIPLTDEDIKNMVEVLNQPDGILYGIDKNDGRKLFFFLKDAGNGLYNLTEVCSTKKGNLTAKSFFKSKKKGIDQRVMEIKQSLLPTSVTYSGEFLSSGAKIPTLFDIDGVSDENVADDGVMFRDGGAADAEKQSRRGTPNLYPDHITQAIYEQSVKGFKFDLDEAWHDSLLSVKRLQEAISETRGVPIRDFENVYWHAVALSSVNAAEMEQLMNLRIQPFIEAVQDICKKHGLTQEDIEVYLNCKHGLERNEAMACKFAKTKAEEEFEAELKKAQKAATANPNDQAAQLALSDVQLRMNDREEELYLENREKDYSGLTDIFDPKDKVTGDRLDLTVSELEDKAKKCVDEFENKVGVADVTKLWDNIHELNNYSLRKSYLSGLISKSQYDSVKQMYQWYVPLRGFNEEVAGDVYTYVTRGETRTQQLLKEAKGRTSRAGDILATMMNMANSAVNQGNRNLMKQKILNLALNAKSPLLSVSSTWYQTDANGFDVPIEPPINDQMTPSEQKDAIEQWEDTMEMLAKQGKVHRMSDNLRLNLRTQKWQADEHCIRVQRGGKEYCVWVNGNPRAAQALNDRLGNQVTKPYKATETILDKAEDLFTDGFMKMYRYIDEKKSPSLYRGTPEPSWNHNNSRRAFLCCKSSEN